MKEYSPNNLPPWGFPHGVLLAPGHTAGLIHAYQEICKLVTTRIKERISSQEKSSIDVEVLDLPRSKSGWGITTCSYCVKPTPTLSSPSTGTPSKNCCLPITKKKQSEQQDIYDIWAKEAAAKESLRDGLADVLEYADPQEHYLFRTYWGQKND